MCTFHWQTHPEGECRACRRVLISSHTVPSAAFTSAWVRRNLLCTPRSLWHWIQPQAHDPTQESSFTMAGPWARLFPYRTAARPLTSTSRALGLPFWGFALTFKLIRLLTSTKNGNTVIEKNHQKYLKLEVWLLFFVIWTLNLQTEAPYPGSSNTQEVQQVQIIHAPLKCTNCFSTSENLKPQGQ